MKFCGTQHGPVDITLQGRVVVLVAIVSVYVL